jgi:hypothetical protein
VIPFVLLALVLLSLAFFIVLQRKVPVPALVRPERVPARNDGKRRTARKRRGRRA